MFPAWIKLLKNWKPEDMPRFSSGRYEWRVYFESARHRRLAGILEFGDFSQDRVNDLPQDYVKALASLFASCGSVTQKKWEEFCGRCASKFASSSEFFITFPVRAGLVGKFTRLKGDEKSVDSVVYGPMEPLLSLIDRDRSSIIAQNRRWVESVKAFLMGMEGDESLNGQTCRSAGEQALSNLRDFIWEKLRQIESGTNDVKISPSFAWTFSWDKPAGKFQLALEFLLSVLKLARCSPDGFEWKELGAQIQDFIGGSKRFDRDRDKLLALAHDVLGMPLEDLGLTSRGSLYSVYVLGKIRLGFNGATDALSLSSLHALTNLEIEMLRSAETSAKRVLLTENRALLIKMFKTGWYEKEPQTLVVGIDGRLRLGHRRFLEILRECLPHAVWFVWTDSDCPGLSFVEDLHGIFPQCRVVFIDDKSLRRLGYEDWCAVIRENPRLLNREQESFLGGPKEWDAVFAVNSQGPPACSPPSSPHTPH